MKKHKDTIRGFHVSNRAHYKNIIPEPEIMIGMYHPGGGSSGEFRMRWEIIGGKLMPQVRLFDESWSLFVEFRDLFIELAKLDGLNPDQDMIIHLLKSLGFKDLTRYSAN
jgi:hypothetical protein